MLDDAVEAAAGTRVIATRQSVEFADAAALESLRTNPRPRVRRVRTPDAGGGESFRSEGIAATAGEVVTKLSFSHIAELVQCDNATKRTFYELECMRGNRSVRELKRQIASLYYKRSGLSSDKLKLATGAQTAAERYAPARDGA